MRVRVTSDCSGTVGISSLSLSLSSISLSSLSLLYFRGSASVSIASGLPLRRVQQDGGMRLNQVVPGCEKLLKC